MQKILTAILILLVLTVGLCCPVSAAELPDLDRPSSITFVAEYDGIPLNGGYLILYRVGRIAPDGSHFVLVESLASDGPSLDDLQAPGLAGTLNELALAHNLESLTAPIADGRAVFTGLEPGLYVVSQRAEEVTPGYAPIDPFLITLPQWMSGVYVYDLIAVPKVPLVPAPTEPTDPTTPTDPEEMPDLPQTGQLNWPIPLMTVLGLALFALGWGLFFGSKRRTA